MVTVRVSVALVGALWLLGGVSPIFAASVCADLENKKPESRLEYLQGERARLDRNCVLYSIEQLGNGRYVPAIKTLVGYLDYRKPDPPGFGDPAAPHVVSHPEWSGSLYPAGTALAQIGKPAVPQLVDVIADAATSDLVRNKRRRRRICRVQCGSGRRNRSDGQRGAREDRSDGLPSPNGSGEEAGGQMRTTVEE